MGMDIGAGVVASDADGDRLVRFAPHGPGEYLRRARDRSEDVEGLVLAVPDDWFDVGREGALRREALHRHVCSELGVPPGQFVPRSAAAVASTAHSESAGGGTDWLVCHIATDGVGVGLCRLRGASVEPLGATSSPAPDELADLAEFARFHGSSRPERRRRAELLLARAQAVPRYRAAPVYPDETGEGAGTFTAGAVISGFARLEAALKTAVLGLVKDRDAPHRVLMSGGPTSHPLALDAVREVLEGPASQHVEVIEPDAAARGALLIARGTVRVSDVARHSVNLAVHRLHRGRLVEAYIPLTVAGGPVPLTVTDQGDPLTVDVPRPGDFRLGIDVEESGKGPHRALDVPHPPLPEGSCRLGLHAQRNGLGVLALRPVEGGESVLVPLDAKTTEGAH
ncbi:hypothetical protein ACFU9Y_19225 [Streptomyces sp. NPDC057621]|uniref:hypothetical protein n=1 Tax=Streptomyces sp. NPDC057621 TaxID=3346186 RepID=UPI00368C019B